MYINIKTTNTVLTPAISDYVTKRFEKISKILENDSTIKCDVELAKTTDHHQKGDLFKAEIHIIGRGINAYASSEKDSIMSAIDDVQEDVLREISGAKSKKVSLVRRGGVRVKNILKGLWPWGKNSQAE